MSSWRGFAFTVVALTLTVAIGGCAPVGDPVVVAKSGAAPANLAVDKSWELLTLESRVLRLRSGGFTRSEDLAERVRAACWSPDGSQIAYLVGATVHLMEMKGRRHRKIVDLPIDPGDLDSTPDTDSGSGVAIAWQDDGRTLWLSGPAPNWPQLLVADIQTGQHFVLPQYDWYKWEANPSPRRGATDGTLAYVANGDIFLGQSTPSPEWEWMGVKAHISQFHHRSGRLDATATPDVNYYANNWTGYVIRLEWSPDGRRLLYVTRRRGGSGIGDVGILEVSDKNEVAAKTILNLPDDAYELFFDAAFTPDGLAVTTVGTEGFLIHNLTGGRAVAAEVVRDFDWHQWRPRRD